MKKFFVNVFYFCVSLTVLFANLEAQEATRLSGKLVKKYYPAPRIVKNTAFGWYLELNKTSQEVIQKQFEQLSKDDQRIFKELDINLQTVQCAFSCDDVLLKARSLDGVLITMEGKLETPCLSRKYLCFSIEPDAILSKVPNNNIKSHFSLEGIAKLQFGAKSALFVQDPDSAQIAYPQSSMSICAETGPAQKSSNLASKASFATSSLDKFDHLSQHFYIESEASNESEIEPLLKLPEDAPEKLVTLKGKLVLRLFPGPPEYTSIEKGDRADYCWMLHVNEEFFKIATTTPVSEPCSDLKSIMEWSNHDEIYLSLEETMTDFCCDHESKEITVQGYLFHAHTAHHYSPILMDVKKVSNSQL